MISNSIPSQTLINFQTNPSSLDMTAKMNMDLSNTELLLWMPMISNNINSTASITRIMSFGTQSTITVLEESILCPSILNSKEWSFFNTNLTIFESLTIRNFDLILTTITAWQTLSSFQQTIDFTFSLLFENLILIIQITLFMMKSFKMTMEIST